MNKKAMEISPTSVVVVVVLLLVALVIMLFIFGDSARSFIDIITGTRRGLVGDNCEAPLLNHRCDDNCGEGFTAKRLQLPSGKSEWADCKEKYQTNSCYACERT